MCIFFNSENVRAGAVKGLTFHHQLASQTYTKVRDCRMQNHGHKTLQDVEFCSHLYTLGVLSEAVKCQIKPQVNLLRGGQCHGVAVLTWEKSFFKIFE